MKKYSLTEMVKGWFIGNFAPSIVKTSAVEVGIKRYAKGDKEGLHHHRVAEEITVIVSGKAKMNGITYEQDDIVYIDRNEATDFEALEDTITAVVKLPSAKGDKYDGKL